MYNKLEIVKCINYNNMSLTSVYSSIFRPDYISNGGSFIGKINAYIPGDVNIGNSTTTYSLNLNGVSITSGGGGGGDPTNWSSYPAKTFVNLDTQDLTGIGTFNGLPVTFGRNPDIIGIGSNAASNNIGSNVIGIGSNASSNNKGSNVVALGTSAGQNSSGDSITSIGYFSGLANSGSSNLFLGELAGQNNAGNNVTAIGFNSGYGNTGSNSIFLGNNPLNTLYSGNNLFVVYGTSSAPLIYGDSLTKKVAIGTSTLSGTLNVGGDTNINGTIVSTSNTTTGNMRVFGTATLNSAAVPNNLQAGSITVFGTLSSSSIGVASNIAVGGISPPQAQVHIFKDATTSPATLWLTNKFAGYNSGGDITESQIFMGSSIGPFHTSIQTRIPNGQYGDGPRMDLCTPYAANDNTQTPRISITSGAYGGGRVGINKTNPTASLDVNGDVKLSGTLYVAGKNVGLLGLFWAYQRSGSTGEYINSGTSVWKTDGTWVAWGRAYESTTALSSANNTFWTCPITAYYEITFSLQTTGTMSVGHNQSVMYHALLVDTIDNANNNVTYTTYLASGTTLNIGATSGGALTVYSGFWNIRLVALP